MTLSKVSEFSTCFTKLPGCIDDISSSQAFENGWKTVFSTPEAKINKEIVYIWATDKNISRLKGESNIIYIGKTINSIHDRHFKYANLEATGRRNRPRYKHIIESFGPISFYVTNYKDIGSNVKDAEKKLLQAYFDDHLEYPPLNRMGK